MRSAILLATLAMVFSVTAASQTARWTFMVYLAADNDLEPYAIADFNEMEMVGSTSDLNILVQFDRSPKYDASNGNWSDTRRFRVVQDGDPNTITSPVLENLGEVNMGSPQALVEFLSWGVQNYPADHYCLVLWDHGGGWRLLEKSSGGLRTTRLNQPEAPASKDQRIVAAGPPGGRMPGFVNPFGSGWGPLKDVCVDETNSDRLLSDEIQSALAASGTVLDILGYDACFMGMIENAYEIRGMAHYLVASEETEPGDGWAYDLLLSALQAAPSMTPAELSTTIVRTYGTYYQGGSGNDQTLSAVDLTKIPSVVSALDGLATSIVAAGDWNLVKQALERTDSYNQGQNVDLFHFADRLGGLSGAGTIQAATQALKDALGASVIEYYTESGHAGAHGVAVYCPPSSAYDPRYADGTLRIDLSRDTQWDEFLRAYHAGGGTTTATDPYEPNDTYTTAYGPITSGTVYSGTISGRADVDLFKIAAGSVFDVRIDLTVPADYDLLLIQKTGEQVTVIDSSMNANLDPELIARGGLSPGEYFVAVVYLWQDDNTSPDPYQLQVTMSGGGGEVTVSLQYDDGSPEGGVFSDRFDMHEGLACYFTPPVVPARLRGIAYYISALDAIPEYGWSSGSFYVFGSDYYGPLLTDTLLYVTPPATGWNLVNLDAEDIVLSGDFFAGMYWDAWNTPMIGWDTTATNGMNLVFTDQAGVQDWYLWSGTFFIRAIVTYVNEVTGIAEEAILEPNRKI